MGSQAISVFIHWQNHRAIQTCNVVFMRRMFSFYANNRNSAINIFYQRSEKREFSVTGQFFLISFYIRFKQEYG